MKLPDLYMDGYIIPISFTTDGFKILVKEINPVILSTRKIGELSVEDAKCLLMALEYAIQETEKAQAERYRNIMRIEQVEKKDESN